MAPFLVEFLSREVIKEFNFIITTDSRRVFLGVFFFCIFLALIPNLFLRPFLRPFIDIFD